jgi:hypothetical protein
MELKEYLHKTYTVNSGQQPPIRINKIDRDYIPELLAKFNMTKGAEIGVESGKYSEIMFKKIPNLELICVDSWEVGEDKTNEKRGQQLIDTLYEETKKRLSLFKATIIKGKSMDVVRNIPYESLDFVYIDACHQFDFVMQDIIEWSKRVKKGGLVAGHDYYQFRNSGVIEAVNAYTRAHGIYDVFLTKEPSGASWFWVKE